MVITMNFKNIVIALVVVYINFALYLAGYVFLNVTIVDDLELSERNTYYLKEDFKVVWNKRINRDAYELQQREIVNQLSKLMKSMPDSLNRQQLKKSIFERKGAEKVKIKWLEHETEEFQHEIDASLEFYTVHEMNLRLVGSYRDIVTYLHEMETGGDIIVAAQEFSMTALEGDKVQLTGVFHSYHYHAELDTKEIYEKWVSEYKDYDQAL